MDLVAEILPQMMRQTGLSHLAVTLALAFGSIEGLAYSIDNFSDIDFITGSAEQIAATRPPHAADELASPQFGKQLLQVGQRDILPFGDVAQVYGTICGIDTKVEHRGNRVSAFCCQSHDLVFPLWFTGRILLKPSISVKYIADNFTLVLPEFILVYQLLEFFCSLR
jgi:hypothetical protein